MDCEEGVLLDILGSVTLALEKMEGAALKIRRFPRQGARQEQLEQIEVSNVQMVLIAVFVVPFAVWANFLDLVRRIGSQVFARRS